MPIFYLGSMSTGPPRNMLIVAHMWKLSVAQQSRRSVLQQRISYSMPQNMSSSVFLAWRRFLALQS